MLNKENIKVSLASTGQTDAQFQTEVIPGRWPNHWKGGILQCQSTWKKWLHIELWGKDFCSWPDLMKQSNNIIVGSYILQLTLPDHWNYSLNTGVHAQPMKYLMHEMPDMIKYWNARNNPSSCRLIRIFMITRLKGIVVRALKQKERSYMNEKVSSNWTK